MGRSETPLGRIAGALFAAVAVGLFVLDEFTAVPASAGFDTASPLAVAVGVAAVLVLGVLWFVTDDAP